MQSSRINKHIYGLDFRLLCFSFLTPQFPYTCIRLPAHRRLPLYQTRSWIPYTVAPYPTARKTSGPSYLTSSLCPYTLSPKAMPYQYITTSNSVPSAASKSAMEAKRQEAVEEVDRRLKNLDAKKASLQDELARARSNLADTQAQQSRIAREEGSNADTRPSQGTYNSIHDPKRVSRFTAAKMA